MAIDRISDFGFRISDLLHKCAEAQRVCPEHVEGCRSVQGWGCVVLPAIAGGGLLVLAPLWLSDYAIHVLIISLYYTILAASWNLLAGYTGQFSLAHHAFAAIGGYASGLLIHHFDVPIYLGIIAAVFVSLVFGFLLGVLVLKMRAIYLAIATWAFAETTRILVTAGYQITRGDLGLHVPSLFGTLEPRPYYYLFLGLTFICISIMYFIVRSPIGSFMRAIKDDELAAAAMGVDTVRWKLFVFSVTSCLAGVAGVFYGHYIGLLSPVMMQFYEIGKIIIMVIIGGLGSFVGPLIGAPLVVILFEYLREYAEWRVVVFALLVIAMMRLHREGAVSLLRRLYLSLFHPKYHP
ncbi:MAG: branched-chain amino acid ABC transporter permease [Anaerolineae bacterium]